jgi:hypothetical protein
MTSRFCAVFLTVFMIAAQIVLFSGNSGAQTSALRGLEDKGTATFEDGCRGIAALLKLPEASDPFDKLLEVLRKEKLVSKRWKAEPDASLTWGRISYMLCRALKIRGGLIMTLTGTTERYAFRECVAKGLMPRGSKGRYLSGADLMAILYRAEIYIKTH